MDADILDELFLVDRREAWARYLRDTRDVDPGRYEEVESWAWRRLTRELSAALQLRREQSSSAASTTRR